MSNNNKHNYSNELGFEQLLATDLGLVRTNLLLLLLILTGIQYPHSPNLWNW